MYQSQQRSSLQYRVRNTFLDFQGFDEPQNMARTRTLSVDSLQDLQGGKAAYHVFVPDRYLQPQLVTSLNNIVDEYYGSKPRHGAGINGVEFPYIEDVQNMTRRISAFAPASSVRSASATRLAERTFRREGKSHIADTRSCRNKSWPIEEKSHANLTNMDRACSWKEYVGLRMVQKAWDWSQFNLEGTDIVTDDLELCDLTPLSDWEYQLINSTEKKKKKKKSVQSSRDHQALSIHGKVTTLLVRNVVCSYSDEEILQVLDEMGFKGKYDFVYVPKGSQMQANFGYFFLNLKSPEYAKECEEVIAGRKFGPRRTHKVCVVQVADRQGIDLVRHIEGKRAKRGFVPQVRWCLE